MAFSTVDYNESILNDTINSTKTYVQSSFADIDIEDTNWILTSAFIIFTMQTGFGMLESGCVSIKNEANIMMKNLVDIVLGGLTYWIFGYGMSFGESPPGLENSFVALGGFFIDPNVGDQNMGPIFAAFLFQLSFATTSTTIVSGAMAERCNFKAYCIFSFVNTIVYCIPAGWVWGTHGFLYKMGVVDIAGSGPVHLIGGSASFASAMMLGPRLGRYSKGNDPLPLGSPVNAVMGLFVLWWGWLAFNSGSTYGVSGSRWQYAARAAVMTMMGSFGGGILALGYTMFRNKGRADVIDLINGVLGSLVSVTAGCYLYRAWEALLIGSIGGLIACLTMPMFDLMKVDDPVGASSVHGCAGIWGVIAVGLFADNPIPLDTTRGRSGLFKGGGWYLLGVQCLAALCLSLWGVFITMLILWMIDRIIPIRMDPYEELLGADVTEHRIRHGGVGVSRALSALRPYHEDAIEQTTTVGHNPGHHEMLEKFYKSSHGSGRGEDLPPMADPHPHHHHPDGGSDGPHAYNTIGMLLHHDSMRATDTNKKWMLKSKSARTSQLNAFNMKFNEISNILKLERSDAIRNPAQVPYVDIGTQPRVSILKNRKNVPRVPNEKLGAFERKTLNILIGMDEIVNRENSEDDSENNINKAKIAWIN